jgi:hypothetical protein
MPKSRALVFLGYILEDANPEEQPHFLQQVPAPVCLLFNVWGRRVQRREAAHLRLGCRAVEPS